jgi:hypothetical protein
MKTKVLLIASAAILAVGVAKMHSGHGPKDGKCPLKAAMTTKK